MTAVPMVSLYLSRLLLNQHSRQVMGEVEHPYEMHRTLMRAFPKATDDTQARARNEFGVLFRPEVDDLRGTIRVYVQSHVEPDWSILDGLNDYLYADTQMPAWEHKDIMPACRKIQNGQILAFRLRANPTKRIAKHGDTMKGKRVELRREDEQIEWLIRKGWDVGKDVSGGFCLVKSQAGDSEGELRLVPNVRVSCEGKRTGRKRDAAGGHATTHLAVLFDGLLQVTNAETFLDTLVQGIGPGKAFGFGLLSVAPVPTRGLEVAT